PIVRTTFRTEPERARQHVRLEHRLQHDLHRGLHYPVTNRRNRQRPRLALHARFRDEHPPGRKRPIPPLPQFVSHLIEQSDHSVLLDLGQGDAVDARCTLVCAHRDPPTPQDVSAKDLVPQRMKPSPGIGLGRPVQRMLQGTNRICGNKSRSGGTSHVDTHRALPNSNTHRRSSGPSLTGGYVVRSAQAVLRPPPTPTRHTPTSRITGYRARRSSNTIRRSPGRGGPLQFPPPPSI